LNFQGVDSKARAGLKKALKDFIALARKSVMAPHLAFPPLRAGIPGKANCQRNEITLHQRNARTESRPLPAQRSRP
jgi:hypothetical protein